MAAVPRQFALKEVKSPNLFYPNAPNAHLADSLPLNEPALQFYHEHPNIVKVCSPLPHPSQSWASVPGRVSSGLYSPPEHRGCLGMVQPSLHQAYNVLHAMHLTPRRHILPPFDRSC